MLNMYLTTFNVKHIVKYVKYSNDQLNVHESILEDIQSCPQNLHYINLMHDMR